MSKLTVLELGQFLLWGAFAVFPMWLASASGKVIRDDEDTAAIAFLMACAAQVAFGLACYFGGIKS